jgi:hypothetical protein
VSDLTGRAEELEREVTELRRENGWLKEIVMLKGRHLGLALPAASGEGGVTSDDSSSESSAEHSNVDSIKRGKMKGKGKGKEKD